MLFEKRNRFLFRPLKAAFLLLAGGFFLHSASAQEFKTNDEGNRVYIHEDGDEYCWDCYPTSPWTEQARHFLAKTGKIF